MSYLVKAAAYHPDGSDQHYTAVRWRSDDPWGAIWRCLYEALHPFIEYPPEMKEKHIVQLTIDLHFKPDVEDVVSDLFPDSPLEKHRPPRPGRKPRQNGKTIPTA